MLDLIRRLKWRKERKKQIAKAMKYYEKYTTEELANYVINWGEPDGPGDYAAKCEAETVLEKRLELLTDNPQLYLAELRRKNR